MRLLRHRKPRRWVHPSTHEIAKFFPSNPPERGDLVLVDDKRCRVVKAKVSWDGATWTLHQLQVEDAV